MSMSNHHISMSLELVARRALNLNGRGGLYGVIDADYIDQIGKAFTVLVATLSPYYRDSNLEIKERIDVFLERFYFLDNPELDREQYFNGVNQATNELRNLLRELS